jgi:hypothetical protein
MTMRGQHCGASMGRGCWSGTIQFVRLLPCRHSAFWHAPAFRSHQWCW